MKRFFCFRIQSSAPTAHITKQSNNAAQIFSSPDEAPPFSSPPPTISKKNTKADSVWRSKLNNAIKGKPEKTQEDKSNIETASLHHCLDRLNNLKLNNLKNSVELEENPHIAAGLDDDVCETASMLVSHVLCRVHSQRPAKGSLETLKREFKQHHEPNQKTVYSVHIPGLSHSLAIARVGNKAMLLQSWVGNYTLREWLEGTRPQIAHNPWLPKNGVKNIADIYSSLASISRSVQRQDQNKAFAGIAEMFGPFNARTTVITGMHIPYILNKAALTVHWSKAPIQEDATR